MRTMCEKSLDSELWHACAGSMVQIPEINTRVVYFPQGHSEHAISSVDFGSLPRIPPMILCRVEYVNFLADLDTDEVYVKMGLVPVEANSVAVFDDEGILGSDLGEKSASFVKTLTQSDANNGGGFSVPRYCAETIFPPLDYKADPPLQSVFAKDIHGRTWKFRHIYRGTPRRHLLTTGWSNFVNHKKLVAGDSVVFLRSENGDLCIGTRRAKRDIVAAWKYDNGGNTRGFSGYIEGENNMMREKGKVRPEKVMEAALLAASGQPFEIVNYPRAGTPEFCVKASSVKAAMRAQWCSGMRFKMAFETEDSSRISWFMGTIAYVRYHEPTHWPNSPWRLLQVTWDEPDLLQDLKSVSPWLVEVVSNMPLISISPTSSPRKKLRLLHPTEIPIHGLPPFSVDPLFLRSSSGCCQLDNIITPSIQGTRQFTHGVPFPDLHGFNNKMRMEVVPPNFSYVDKSSCITDDNEDISCMLSMGYSGNEPKKKDVGSTTTPMFVLFGQPILTEQQLSAADREPGSYSVSA